MKFNDHDRTIGLAGIFQAAWCAQRIAGWGRADDQAMSASLFSVFQIDADDVSQVFAGSQGVASGLRQVLLQIQGGAGRDMELTRYVVALMHLERKLNRDPRLQARIGEGIASIRRQLAQFSVLHPTILARLADVYSETLGTLRPRILVRGKELYLTNSDNVNRIRALLLAGVRAARLWRQVGGRRRQILFGRGRLAGSAAKLLEEIASLEPQTCDSRGEA